MGKIADADTVIHVFGTFHGLPKGLRWHTAKFAKGDGQGQGSGIYIPGPTARWRADAAHMEGPDPVLLLLENRRIKAAQMQ